ncbi:hypothetical protein EZV62_026065 [Acer yangbiense]|uniref:Uncharacterized protein n=1 Tax=Acer yangbiense TaxID=1000413 RepID=A0A5C7GPN8_9ROSI|nr:hypothetical protein EZV62_026065 [Acer yangbiense]
MEIGLHRLVNRRVLRSSDGSSRKIRLHHFELLRWKFWESMVFGWEEEEVDGFDNDWVEEEVNEEEASLFDMLWLLLASVIIVPLFQKIPGGCPVLGYLAAGILIYAICIGQKLLRNLELFSCCLILAWRPSPEIQTQCGDSTLAFKTTTPACYAAGYIVSGVTDKRKCRSRGILTVGDNNLLDLDMVPLPAEASRH